MWEQWWTGRWSAVICIAVFGVGCSESGGEPAAGAGSNTVGGNGGASGSVNAGGGSAGGGGASNAGAGGGGGGPMPPWADCEAPATKCKGYCLSAESPLAPDCALLTEGNFSSIQLVGDTLYAKASLDVVAMPKEGGALTTVLAGYYTDYFHVSGDHVYFASEMTTFLDVTPKPVGGYVARAALAGGPAEFLVDELEAVRAIRIVGDTLIFGQSPLGEGSGFYSTGPIAQLSIDTAATLTVLVPSYDGVGERELAIDGQFLYAAVEPEASVGQIVKVPLAGGAAEVLYEGGFNEAFDLVVHEGVLYWVSHSSTIAMLAEPTRLGRIELATGENTVLAETDGFSTRPTSDGEFVYIASSTVLWRVPVTGGEPERVLTTDSYQIGPYLLDGDSLIIALTGEEGRVAGLLRTSTDPESLPTE